jgi:hypothetical protein
MSQAHRMTAAVPSIEVAHHRNALRVGRPHGETHAGDAADRHGVRAQHVGRAGQAAFVKRRKVAFVEQRAEHVRIGARFASLRPGNAPAVGSRAAIEHAHEGAFAERHGVHQHGLIGIDQFGMLRAWRKQADFPASPLAVRPQPGERIGVTAFTQRPHIGLAADVG